MTDIHKPNYPSHSPVSRASFEALALHDRSKDTIHSPNHPLCFTLLQAPPGRPQRKRIDAYGSTHAIPPLVWGTHYFQCQHPRELGVWLKRLEAEPSLILIRGCPRPERAHFIESPGALADARADVERSWGFAQPIYRDLSSTRRALKQLESDSQAKQSKAREDLELRLNDYFEALDSIGWVARRKSIFKEVPRQWVWLDLDQGLDLHEDLPLNHRTDHHAALRWIVQQGLPEAFHEVSFVGQWSSSAFLRGRKVKAHFAFMFDQPLGEGALKAWHGVRAVQNWPLKWDVATFRTVQPHYTAAPRFVGVSSPLNDRTFWVQGLRDFVHIDELSLLKLNAQGRAVSPRTPDSLTVEAKPSKPNRITQRSHTPEQLVQTTKIGSDPHLNEPTPTLHSLHPISDPVPPTQVTHLDNPAVDESPEVARVLNAQVDRLSHAPEGQRNQILYRCACVLGRYVGGGLLSLPHLIQGLLKGAHQCGLLSEVGELECLRQIHNGVRWGRKRPIKDSPLNYALSLKDHLYNQQLLNELRRAVERATLHPQIIPVIALTCGGGKTTAMCSLMAEDAALGLTRVVLCRNHAMAQAFKDDLERYAREQGINLNGRVKLLEGMQRHCRILKEASPRSLKALNAALAYGRRALCGQGDSRCEYASHCEGAKRPRAMKQGITIATHSMGPLLEIPEGAITLIDELPTPVTTRRVNVKDFAPFITSFDHVEIGLETAFQQWLKAHSHISIAAQAVQKMLKWLASAPNLVEQDYGQTLDPEEALLIFQEIIEPLADLQDLDVAPLPLPSSKATRNGIWPTFPERGVLEVLLELARQIPDGIWPSALSIHWKNQEVWIEVRELYDLPTSPLVCLDGTAHRTEQLWSSLGEHTSLMQDINGENFLQQERQTYILNKQPQKPSQADLLNLEQEESDTELSDLEEVDGIEESTLEGSNRRAEIWNIAAVGEPPLFARWVKTQQLRTSQLIRRDARLRIHWRKRSLGSLKRVAFTIERAARDAGLQTTQRIGILAAKHVSDLFRVAFQDDVTPQFETNDQRVQELVSSLKEALGERELVIGHIGAHDIGSNLYHGVDLLAMLGSSKPDWGATIADLRSLGIAEGDCHEVYSQIVSARDVQGLARARHLRRPRVGLLYIGDMPPPVGHDLPDVRWEQVEPAHPRPSTDQQLKRDGAEKILFDRGFITVPLLRRELQLTRAKAQATCQRLTRQHDLIEWIHQEGGRGRGAKAFGFPQSAPSSSSQLLNESKTF